MRRSVEQRDQTGVFRSWISDVVEKIKEWLTIPMPVPVPVPKPDASSSPSRKSS